MPIPVIRGCLSYGLGKGKDIELNLKRHTISAFLLLLSFATQSWAEPPPFLSSAEWSTSASTLPQPTKQVVAIKASRGVTATITLWQKVGDVWTLTGGPWPAVIGKNGMALHGQKREGDGKSPAGLFPISLVFGEAEHFATGLPYRRTTDQDIWIDDPQSTLYNQWSQLPTTASSFERMKRKDVLYKLGLVVDYNQNPIVPGAGSAIFIHVWRNETKGTAGCAALAEKNLKMLVEALKRDDNPVALFLP